MGSNKLSLVGLAFRAGKMLAGSAACEKGAKQRQIVLMLLQEGLSPSSKRAFTELCERTGTKVKMVSEEYRLGDAIGRPGIMVLGVTDKGFADAIIDKLDGGSGIE